MSGRVFARPIRRITHSRSTVLIVGQAGDGRTVDVIMRVALKFCGN